MIFGNPCSFKRSSIKLPCRTVTGRVVALRFPSRTVADSSLTLRAAAGLLAFGLLLFFGVLGPIAKAAAQAQSSGTVGGRVTDASGAAVPGARITLKSQDQGRVVNVSTNSSGEYTFNSVPAATYTVTITAPSFADYVVKDLVVNAESNPRLDATLRPAAESASITVEADGTTVDMRSATIATVIDTNLVENLPLDGNNVVEVAALLPGVTDVNAPTTFTNDQGGPTYNISGARANQNLFLFDGALYNNLFNNTGLNYPPRHALQEVSVLLNNFKAQYGRNVGSVFNVISKRGTNNFHGQLWEFAQNQAFNAADYISQKNPHLVQNQFGATLGGPIWRDKLFFFLAYQDLRSSSAVTAQAFTLTTSERGLQADGVTPRPCTFNFGAGVTSCASFAEDVTKLTNPIKGSNAVAATSSIQAAWQVAGGTGIAPCITALSAAPNNLATFELPSSCFNPVAQNLLKRFPLPTQGAAAGALPYAISQANQPRNDQDGLVRVDWNLARHTIAARYYQTSVDDITANGVNNGEGVATYEQNNNIAAIHMGNIDDTYVITPNMLNVVRLAYKRYLYNISPVDTTTLADLGSNIALVGHPTLPRISIDSRFNVGTANQNYSISVNEDVEFDDSLSFVHGKHNFQTGLEYLRLQYLHVFDQAPSLTFSNSFSGIPAADFMAGLVTNSTFGNGTNQSAIQHDLYLYAQDDWRITTRLTLNYGLRYEIPFQWYQPDGQAATFIPGFQSKVFPNAPPNIAYVGDSGVERSLVGTSYTNFAPRTGFAYDVFGNGRLSIRGGFGIFYDAINALVVGVTQPFHYEEKPAVLPGGLSQPLLNQQAVPQNYVKGQPAQYVLPYSITFADRNFTTPYTEAMNFGFQLQIKRASRLEMNYVSRLGRHQALGFDLNPAIYDCSGSYFQASPSTYCLPSGSTSQSTFATSSSYLQRVQYPNFNYGGAGVLDYMSVGSSSYHGLQIIYTARSQKGLTTLASYTFSKSLDVSSNGTGIVNSSDQPTLGVHRALSDFNSRHILNIGFVYKFPLLRHSAALVRGVVNGWSVNGIYTARTGHPFSVTTNGDQSLRNEKVEYGSFVAGGYVPLASNRHRTDKVVQWFNTAAICAPAQYANPCPTSNGFGNAPRNYFVGPAFINTQLSLSRTFKFAADKPYSFVFRADAFNAFNTPNLGQPQGSFSTNAAKSTTFGHIISTAGGNGAVNTNGRRLQLSGTFNF